MDVVKESWNPKRSIRDYGRFRAMRELYACQLDLRETPGARNAIGLIQEWVARGSEQDLAAIEALDATPMVTAEGHELYVALTDELRVDPREWTCSWRHPDERDPGLVWRILIATGPSPIDVSLVRVALRIRLERAGERFRLAPLHHSFAAPAIIRTLLREHEVYDAGERVVPTYTVRRAGEIPALVARLESPDRQLPVLVVTRGPGPSHSVNASDVARAVAGLAHVEVLSTHLAALALTDEIGRESSVWGGAVRLYWPQFTVGEDGPHRHRYWTRSRLEAIHDFPSLLLSYLAALATARVPEHPVVAKARARRRPSEAAEETLPDWAKLYVDALEQDSLIADDEAKAAQAELASAMHTVADLEAELASVRASFYQVHGQEAADVSDSDDETDLDSLTVAAAFKLAKNEASEHVVYLPSVDDSIADFATYKLPRRLYEALTAISEAADGWHSGALREGFGRFFADRGYEFSKNNPAATARNTKSHYQRQHAGAAVTMQPHLKVDQATTPDQCLRVYWYRDDTGRRLVIGHVGRHLPD